MTSPLYSARYILEEANSTHQAGLLEVFSKLLPEPNLNALAYDSLCRYKMQQGNYGDPTVVRLRKTMSPLVLSQQGRYFEEGGIEDYWFDILGFCMREELEHISASSYC